MEHALALAALIELARENNDYQAAVHHPIEEKAPDTNSLSLSPKNLFFTASVLGMTTISRVIEDQGRYTEQERMRFYAGFQKLSRYLPQKERYQAILERRVPVYLFGVPDVSLPDTVPDPYIISVLEPPLTNDKPLPRLSDYWFVVLYNPDGVGMALLARELFTTDPTVKRLQERALSRGISSDRFERLIYRQFEGFWTHDERVIEALVGILDDYTNTTTTNPNSFSRLTSLSDKALLSSN